MEATRAEKTRLGLFLILTGSALAVVIIFFVGRKLTVRSDAYFVRISESVTGLEKGSPVKQNGVDIGEVLTITTDRDDIQKAVVHFQVHRGTPMKTDMVATLGSYGITGLKYIEITGGSYDSPDIAPGGEMHAGLSMLGRLAARADSITSKVDQMLGNILAITNGENREHLNRLISSSASLSVAMDSLTRDFESVHPGRNLKQILTDAQATVTDARQKVQATDLQGTVEQVKKTAQTMDITMRNTQEDLTVVLSNLKETLKNLNTFSREIKENPSVLLRGEDKQERQK